jgi:hypothetical protein
MTGRRQRLRVIPSALAVMMAACSGQPGSWHLQAKPATAVEAIEAVGEEAYIYGYPLVVMDQTKATVTAVAGTSANDRRAPVNQFARRKTLSSPADTEVPRPNLDTLYSTAWLDLSRGPVTLSIPAMAERFFVYPIHDAWTNVIASPGTRTLAGKATNLLIAGPDWHGATPAGTSIVRSPTNTALIIGRIQVNGEADLPQVRTLQEQFTLQPSQPAAPTTTAAAASPTAPAAEPVSTVNALDAPAFFSRLMRLMVDNPPSPADAEIIGKMRSLGLVPGRAFRFASLDPAVQQGLTRAVKPANMRIADFVPRMGQDQHGWRVTLRNIGSFGTHYLNRAAATWAGAGFPLPQDAIYPIAFTDQSGQPLTGQDRYVLHFDPGQLPPVNAFWSVTLYDERGFLVPNPLNRHILRDRDPLRFNPDGSLDLYIQSVSPGPEKVQNWLPAPKGPFNLTMRLYWAKPAILSGQWQVPPIRRQP